MSCFMKSYALYRRKANKQGDNISPCPTILISDLWMQNEGGQNKICNELFYHTLIFKQITSQHFAIVCAMK